MLVRCVVCADERFELASIDAGGNDAGGDAASGRDADAGGDAANGDAGGGAVVAVPPMSWDDMVACGGARATLAHVAARSAAEEEGAAGGDDSPWRFNAVHVIDFVAEVWCVAAPRGRARWHGLM